jgi:hypothetical protein
VQLALPLETTSGATHTYLLQTEADGEGRYAFVVPYSTDRSFSSAVRVRGSYQIRSRTRTASICVKEREVASGAKIEGPNLRMAGP